MIKKLFSHTAIYGLAPQISKVAGVIALPFITPFLTETDFGVYGVITAVAAALAVLSTLGLRVVLVNSFYKSPAQFKWKWRQLYGFLSLWNIPLALILALVLYFFIPSEAKHNAIWILLLNILPIVFFGPTTSIATTYYQLKKLPFQIATRTAFFGSLTVLLNVYFIAFLRMGYMGWFLAACISTMLSNISYWIPLHRNLGLKPILNFKWKYLRHSLKIALPTVPHYYSTYLLNTSDRVVMKLLDVPTGNIGLYNVAYTVGNLMNSFGMASTLAIGPMMNEAYKKRKDEEARDLVFILQAITLVMTVGISIWLKEVFFLLIRNEALRHVYPLGIVIVMAYNYRPMYTGANAKLFYVEKTGLLLQVTFVAGLLNVLLNLIFIPLIGFEVAAFTTFITLMYMGYAGFFFKGFKDHNKANYYPLQWLALTVALTVFAYFAVELHYTIKIFISVIALAIGFLTIRRINRNLEGSGR